MTAIVFLGLAALAGVGVWLVYKLRKYYLTEYLFFNRYPIILAGILVVLPLLGPAAAPAVLDNVFVMNDTGIFVTVFLTCFAAWAIVYTAALTTVSTPARSNLTWKREDRRHWENFREAPVHGVIVHGWWTVIAGALPVPTLAVLVLKTDAPSKVYAAMAGCAGIAVAGMLRYGMLYVSQHIVDRESGKAATDPISKLVWPFFSRVPLGFYHRYGDLPESVRILHLKAFWFFLLSIIVYLVFGILGSPARPVDPASQVFPPLSFVMILIAMLAWFLSFLSFHFDTDRVPAVGLVLFWIILFQAFVPSKHEYVVYDWPASVAVPDAAPELLRQRWAKDDSPAVLIAASGGGITASYWTAYCLRELEREIPGFAESVDVISAVSGGCVATMYYVDEFKPDSGPTRGDLDHVVERAGSSSLAAVAWGLAYPDLWRPVWGWAYPRVDRGWALESVWVDRLSMRDADGEPVRLSDWTDGVLAGWRPIHIANATLEESGQRLVLAPVPIIHETTMSTRAIPGQRRPDKEEIMSLRMLKDLFAFMPGKDIKVATSGRLAATFPYVSPHASPDSRLEYAGDLNAYHAADGGYYDNSGLVTIAELLLDTLDRPTREPPLDRIAVIEIRAGRSAQEFASNPPDANPGGFINTAIGPLQTLYNARTSTQISRTALELDLASRYIVGQCRVKVHWFTFHLSGSPPLSWHLTQAQKDDIAAHFPTGDRPGDDEKELQSAWDENREQLEELKKFLDPDVSVREERSQRIGERPRFEVEPKR